jgi:hypothetical protein
MEDNSITFTNDSPEINQVTNQSMELADKLLRQANPDVMRSVRGHQSPLPLPAASPGTSGMPSRSGYRMWAENMPMYPLEPRMSRRGVGSSRTKSPLQPMRPIQSWGLGDAVEVPPYHYAYPMDRPIDGSSEGELAKNPFRYTTNPTTLSPYPGEATYHDDLSSPSERSSVGDRPSFDVPAMLEKSPMTPETGEGGGMGRHGESIMLASMSMVLQSLVRAHWLIVILLIIIVGAFCLCIGVMIGGKRSGITVTAGSGVGTE